MRCISDEDDNVLVEATRTLRKLKQKRYSKVTSANFLGGEDSDFSTCNWQGYG